MTCEKCGGFMRREADGDCAYDRCLICGRRDYVKLHAEPDDFRQDHETEALRKRREQDERKRSERQAYMRAYFARPGVRKKYRNYWRDRAAKRRKQSMMAIR